MSVYLISRVFCLDVHSEEGAKHRFNDSESLTIQVYISALRKIKFCFSNISSVLVTWSSGLEKTSLKENFPPFFTSTSFTRFRVKVSSFPRRLLHSLFVGALPVSLVDRVWTVVDFTRWSYTGSNEVVYSTCWSGGVSSFVKHIITK